MLEDSAKKYLYQQAQFLNDEMGGLNNVIDEILIPDSELKSNEFEILQFLSQGGYILLDHTSNGKRYFSFSITERGYRFIKG